MRPKAGPRGQIQVCLYGDYGLEKSTVFSAYIFTPDGGLIRAGGKVTHCFLPVTHSLSCSGGEIEQEGKSI